MPNYLSGHATGHQREVEGRESCRQDSVVVTLRQETDFVKLVRILGRILRRAVGQIPQQRVERQQADAGREGAGQNAAVWREADLFDVAFAVVRFFEIVGQAFAVVVESGVGRNFGATSENESRSFNPRLRQWWEIRQQQI